LDYLLGTFDESNEDDPAEKIDEETFNGLMERLEAIRTRRFGTEVMKKDESKIN